MRFVVKSGETLMTVRADEWECDGFSLKFQTDGRVVAWFTNWDGFWEE